jgi:hypothetical protein
MDDFAQQMMRNQQQNINASLGGALGVFGAIFGLGAFQDVQGPGFLPNTQGLFSEKKIVSWGGQKKESALDKFFKSIHEGVAKGKEGIQIGPSQDHQGNSGIGLSQDHGSNSGIGLSQDQGHGSQISAPQIGPSQDHGGSQIGAPQGFGTQSMNHSMQGHGMGSLGSQGGGNSMEGIKGFEIKGTQISQSQIGGTQFLGPNQTNQLEGMGQHAPTAFSNLNSFNLTAGNFASFMNGAGNFAPTIGAPMTFAQMVSAASNAHVSRVSAPLPTPPRPAKTEQYSLGA